MRLELCYVNELDKSTMAGTMQCGFRIHGLLGKTQVRLNEWLFKCNIHEVEAENLKLRQERQAALPSRRNANSILVVGPKDIDLDYWYQCLGRKFEVITSDANIANIRDSLNTGPGLVLMYLDPKDPAKASFTRKFCSTLGNRFPIMFFGEESDRPGSRP